MQALCPADRTDCFPRARAAGSQGHARALPRTALPWHPVYRPSQTSGGECHVWLRACQYPRRLLHCPFIDPATIITFASGVHARRRTWINSTSSMPTWS